jgi:hypothetical protein
VLGNTIDGSIASGDIVINNVAPAVAAGTQPAALADPAGIRFVDYCAATYANGGATDIVANVVLNGESVNLTNASGQGLAPAYYTFYNSVNVPDLFTGSTYPISITFGADGTQYAGVWIDFNQNGLSKEFEVIFVILFFRIILKHEQKIVKILRNVQSFLSISLRLQFTKGNF